MLKWIVLIGLIPWFALAQDTRVLSVRIPTGTNPDEACLVRCGATAHDATPLFCRAVSRREVVPITVSLGQCYQAVTRTNGVLSFAGKRSDPEPEEPDENAGRGPAPEFEK